MLTSFSPLRYRIDAGVPATGIAGFSSRSPDDLVKSTHKSVRGWTAVRDQAKIGHGLCRRTVVKWRID